MDDFRTVLKVENNSGLPYSIRSIFNGLGDDPELFPFDTGVPEQSHCFLRFSSSVFADYALTHRLDLKSVRVLPVRHDPRLIAQYQLALGPLLASFEGNPNSNAANSQLLDKRKWSQENPRAAELERETPPRRRNNFMAATSVRTDLGDSGFGEYTSTGMAARLPAVQLASTPFLLPTGEPDLHLDSIASSSNVRTASKLKPLDKPAARSYISLNSTDLAPVRRTLPISLETCITMALCGEVITYDLEGLDSDPRVIIELLKATNSERANYMVAGAFYRRSGNPHGAKAVLISMVEELSKRGVSKQELKPAFLLLSGCEFDLAKLAKANQKCASEHYEAAQVWLQEVFGKAKPVRAEAASHKVPVKQNTPTRPRAWFREGSGSLSKREMDMESEIRKLRERNANQATQLHDLRASKRKFEEDYFHERDLRRKCQRQRDDMEKERDAARKMEGHALEQIKREIVNRRKAEERAEALSKEKDMA